MANDPIEDSQAKKAFGKSEADLSIRAGESTDAASIFTDRPVMDLDHAADRRVRRKIDFHLLPWMCGLYALQYLDKTALSYSSTMGIRQSTHMNNSQYALTGTIFYIGYLVFEYPHNRLMQKLPLAKYISCSVIIWGAMLSCLAACHNFAGIMAVRFFLGGFEGVVTAGFVLVTARWYRQSEQGVRTSIWFTFNGVAQILGGALAYGVSHGFKQAGYSFPSWKAMFLIPGLLTCVYGALLLYFFPDSPLTARWLTEEEKVIAVERLRGNQQGIGNKKFKWYQFREAFTDVRTYLIFVFMVSSNIPNGGLTVFFTSLIQSYGFDADTTFLVSMPGGIVQLITNLGFPYLGSRFGNRMLSAAASMLLGLFGISLMMGLSRDGLTAHRIGQLVGYYITLGNCATALVLILSVIASNTAGYTKKTTVNAVSMIGYCVGFLIGPQTFRDPPYYTNAKWNIIAMWSVSFFSLIALYVVNRRANSKREQVAATLPPQPPGQEFQDLTDRENPYFRYVL